MCKVKCMKMSGIWVRIECKSLKYQNQGQRTNQSPGELGFHRLAQSTWALEIRSSLLTLHSHVKETDKKT